MVAWMADDRPRQNRPSSYEFELQLYWKRMSLPAKAGVAEVVGYLHCTINAVEQAQ